MKQDRRILALDFEFFDDRVDTTKFKSTRTLLEHEIVVWNAENLLSDYDKVDSYLGSPTLSDSASAEFARDLVRREREFQDFFDLGRLMVVLVPQPVKFYVGTGERRNEGTKAKPRMTRLVESRLVSDAIPFKPSLHAAAGDSFEVVGSPAFAALWRQVASQFEYRAFLEMEDVEVLLKVRNTDRVVAAARTNGAGSLLFLPHLLIEEPDIERLPDEEEEDYWERWEVENEALQRKNDGMLIDALLEYSRETQGAASEPLPVWTERLILPGEKKALGSAEAASQRADSALAKAESARIKLLMIQGRKKLITLSGKDLEAIVAEALTDLGCTVEPGKVGRTDRIVKWEGQIAVVEIKGTIKSASEGNATQLEKWVTEYALEVGGQPKGILVVNGWRNLPLDDRTEDVFPKQMLPYAEGRGHCLLASSQLLTAWVTAKTKGEKKTFVEALFNSVGILDGWGWAESLTVVAEDQEV